MSQDEPYHQSSKPEDVSAEPSIWSEERLNSTHKVFLCLLILGGVISGIVIIHAALNCEALKVGPVIVALAFWFSVLMRPFRDINLFR